ncbi:heat-shock protein [Lentzea sp. NBRC 105346]|uniref:Hsp20/alpha crystallin family protein n=1 Tax=Lentzea sp. NBRC 105346 TaxID=3032205 RepID=UPI0024A2E0CA|nr:Hsp20/alpha crystallin family protein [Lentzea sp. NBRC 105346]GLZ28552.1 heat-shock protein [Lentzea sp. NBRC 105346]
MTLPVRRSAGRWDPVREFEDLFDRMGSLLQNTITGAGAWVPSADVCETDSAYVVEIDVPGVKRQDVTIEVTGNDLAVSGELKEREEEGTFRRRTRRVGQFEYRVALPGDLDSEHVEAAMSDGVLTIRVPKAERAKARRVEISGD